MALLRAIVVGTLCLAHAVSAFKPSLSLGDLRKLAAEEETWQEGPAKIHSRTDEQCLSNLYPTQLLTVPVDHFHNDSRYEPHSNNTFELRYWFDATHYQKGGPVIVLQSGETSGIGRLPFLQKGIVAILAKATGGLGVILEHRYYGESYPTPDFTTENMRFLSTDQALADMAYFAQNVVFQGLEDLNLTAPHIPYIAYGGSYAGAFVAFLRKLYPDLYMGAISSSGVTEAIYDYWEYLEAARLFGPQDCVLATQKLTDVIDNILIGKPNSTDGQRLKASFGLGNLTNDVDFVNSIWRGIGGLQDTNWDPVESSPGFYEYCSNITSKDLLYPSLNSLELDVRGIVSAGGHGNKVDELSKQMLNYIGYVNSTVVQSCLQRNLTIEPCLGSSDTEFFHRTNLTAGAWRPWPYQVCTEWGYFLTGSGVPKDQLPLISRLVDLEYTSLICREAFNITKLPELENINKHGGFDISYPRLAFIDGEKDPWRAATPHRFGLPPRENTVSEPFLLIKDGVHHWDENGVFANETTPGFPPAPIVEIQKAEVEFVQAWLAEWEAERKGSSDRDLGKNHGGDAMGDL